MSQAVTAQTLMMGPAFEDGVLGITTIPGGQWSFLMYCYASATAGVNEIKPSIYLHQSQAGTVAITGTGTSRTATVTGGSPFIAGHAHADMEKCSWLRTPNAQLRITAYTSTTEVTVECLSTYVNESGQAYFIDKQLFDVTTGDIENTTVELKTVDSFQQSFACGLTDKIVIRHFAKTDSGSAKTLNLYYGGTQYYSHLLTPIAIKHNDQAGLNEGDYIHLTANEFAYGILNRIVVAKGDSGTSAQVFDVSAGGFQKSTVTGNHTMSFSNWPAAGQAAYLHVQWTNPGAFTITLPTIRWKMGDETVALGYTTTLATYLTSIGRTALRSAGVDDAIFWSEDGGATVWGVLL
jgi:hypothetical protein